MAWDALVSGLKTPSGSGLRCEQHSQPPVGASVQCNSTGKGWCSFLSAPMVAEAPVTVMTSLTSGAGTESDPLTLLPVSFTPSPPLAPSYKHN